MDDQCDAGDLITKITKARRAKNPRARPVKTQITPRRAKPAPIPDPITTMSREEKLAALAIIRAELGIEQHHADVEVLEAEEIDLTRQYNAEVEETAEGLEHDR